MWRSKASGLLLILLAIVPTLKAQQAPRYALAPAPAHAALLMQVRDSIDALMHRYGIPGLSAAIGAKGELIWAEGFGYADVENRVPMLPQTKLRVASVSKSLTSAALGLLIEQGRLDLDAPVQRYVPSFPKKRWPITTRQLAGHLAGIRHYRDQEFYSTRHYDSVLEALEVFKDDTLLFRPDTRFSYSSYGWNLISAVIEGAAGMPFLQFMRRYVFDPLGMYHTVAEHVDSLIMHRARFYVYRDSLLMNAPYVDNSVKWAGGGFLSTASDLVRFGNGLLTGRLLKSETVHLLFTSQRTASGEETGYGLGWRVGEQGGRHFVWHTGGAVGGSSVLVLLPEERVVVALIANLQGVRLAPLGFWIADRVAQYMAVRTGAGTP
ncbi:MAG: serine hydrolase domain-containing protein [Rhodothermus sp.]|nr:serine hydrolase domain-containing protein [Rhodothermus sp.]